MIRRLTFYKDGCFYSWEIENEFEWKSWLYCVRAMVYHGIAKTKLEAWKLRVMCLEKTGPPPIKIYWENANYSPGEKQNV